MKSIIQIFCSILILLLNIPSTAQFLWTTNYTGSFIPSNNWPCAVAIDNSGNVYVTGKSDSSPNESCTTATYIATVMYRSSDGGENWVKRYTGCGIDDDNVGNSIATVTINQHTFVYVAGSAFNIYNGTVDYITIKYDADNDGYILWAKTYNGTGNGTDVSNHIEVDQYGNSYVTGFSWSKHLNGSNWVYNNDYVTIKRDPNGDLSSSWPDLGYGDGAGVRRYNGNANGEDIANSLKVDGAGNVYVTGCSFNNNDPDYATLAYDYNGNLLNTWLDIGAGVGVRRYNSGSNDVSKDIAIDNYRGIFITGSSGANITTIRYDNLSGNVMLGWPKSESGNGNSIRIFRKPCVMQTYCYTMNVFVTGDDGSGAGYGKTVGYDENGNYLLFSVWPVLYPVSSSQFIELSLDLYENVIVTGKVGNSYLIVKYSWAGVPQWDAQYTSGYPSFSTGIKVDASGNSYITGISWQRDQPGYAYYVTRKYGPNGGNFGPTTFQNLNELQSTNEKQQCFSLNQNYPNPFNPSTMIVYSIGKQVSVNLKVFDVLGQEVAVLINNAVKSTGSYSAFFNASNLPSGVYYYKLTAGDFTDIKKMILIK